MWSGGSIRDDARCQVYVGPTESAVGQERGGRATSRRRDHLRREPRSRGVSATPAVSRPTPSRGSAQPIGRTLPDVNVCHDTDNLYAPVEDRGGLDERGPPLRLPRELTRSGIGTSGAEKSGAFDVTLDGLRRQERQRACSSARSLGLRSTRVHRQDRDGHGAPAAPLAGGRRPCRRSPRDAALALEQGAASGDRSPSDRASRRRPPTPASPTRPRPSILDDTSPRGGCPAGRLRVGAHVPWPDRPTSGPAANPRHDGAHDGGPTTRSR